MVVIERQPIKIEAGGITLRGELVSPEESDSLVVLCHGIPLSKPDPSDGGYAEFSRGISEAGHASVFVNFRGTGESGGNFHLGGWYSDLVAVMGLVREELSERFSRIFMAGFSAGGALSIRYAAEYGGVDGVAAFAPPARFTGLFQREYLATFLELAREVGIIREDDFPPDPEAFLAELEENDALDYVSGVSPIPLLLVHGEGDELVPVAESERLFEAAGEPRELVVLSGGAHRLRKDRRSLDTLNDWLAGIDKDPRDQ